MYPRQRSLTIHDTNNKVRTFAHLEGIDPIDAELRRPRISVCELAEPAICWELLVAYLRSEGDAPLNGAAQAFLDLLTFQ